MKLVRSKQILIPGIGMVIILVAVALAALKLTLWSKPSHADFVQAHTDAVALQTKATALQTSYAAYAQDLQTDRSAMMPSDKATYTKALAAYKTAVSKLRDQKATHKDAAIRQVYQKFSDRNVKFLSFTEGYVTDYSAEATFNKLGCASLSFDHNDITHLVQTYRAFLKQCEPSLNRMIASKNEAFQVYGKGMKIYLEARTQQYQNLLDGLNTGNYTKTAAAEKALSAGPDSTMSARIQQAHDDALPNTAIARLVTVTAQRATATK